MSDPVWLALIAAVPTTIAAFGAYTSARNGKKADTILVKADEIHTLTNSNLTSVKADLVAANQKIGDLEQLVNRLVVERFPGKGKEA